MSDTTVHAQPNPTEPPHDLAAVARRGLDVLSQKLSGTIQNIRTQSNVNDAIVARLQPLDLQASEITVPGTSLSQNATADRLPLYLGNDCALCRVLNSFLMYIDPHDEALTPLLLEGCWQPAKTRVFSELIKSGMTVVDVGARFGYFTLIAAAGVGAAGHVVAIEPDARHFQLLNINLQVNGLLDRVRLLPFTASKDLAPTDLRPSPRYSGAQPARANGSLPVSVPHVLIPHNSIAHDSIPSASIATMPLDQMIDGEVDLIKIDAQGTEPLVFAGMQQILTRSPKVRVMMNFSPRLIRATSASPEFLLRQIDEAGFQFRTVTPHATLRTTDAAQLLRSDSATLLLSRD